MATYASQSTVFRGLKETLEEIITDGGDYEDKAQYKQVFTVEKMNDAYEDDVEYGFQGLASETAEATEFPVGTLTPGSFTRYMARKFGIKMMVTQEAVDDNKYDKIIQAGTRCARALNKTMDIDGALTFARAENTAYPGGDGLPLASASHTLPGGGTFSTTMATPMAPSTMGLTLAQTQVDKYPDHSGLREGYLIKKVVHPVDQRFLWSRLVNSPGAPEAGEYNAINVIKHDMDISLVCLRQWSNTTTNWCGLTDADNGLKWKFRYKPRNKSWVQDNQQILVYQVDTRYSRRWSDARCIIWSGA